MRFLDASALDACLDYPALIDALRAGFVDGATAPVRHHHEIDHQDASPSTLLLMPAWQTDQATGVKIVNVHGENPAKGLPAVQGLYLLFDGPTGSPIAVLDGTRLTQLRTAAASALAASYLARQSIDTMLMVGAGALAPELIKAHRSVRPIARVLVWNRTPERAQEIASGLVQDGIRAEFVSDLEAAVLTADLISCATMSTEPLICGTWLKPGCHLDLVGAFKPSMAEADAAAIARSSLFVDTREGALSEAGDVMQAIEQRAIQTDHIRADLFDLAAARHPGRHNEDEITCFKSVGTALEDLAAARLAFRLAGN
ncbi:MAG: ornithine cyclodeaminase family protein [Pseudomonadota bacterium]